MSWTYATAFGDPMRQRPQIRCDPEQLLDVLPRHVSLRLLFLVKL